MIISIDIAFKDKSGKMFRFDIGLD